MTSPQRSRKEFRATPSQRALLTAYCTAVLCIASLTAQAQQGYYASIGSATHYVTENFSRSDCMGTENSGGGPSAGDVLSTLDLRPELRLFKYASGRWKSGSVTVYVPETAETGFTGGNTYTSSISSAGIVTTHTSGAISGNSISLVEETATDSSVETLDLNTGRYTWHRVINESYPGGTCPFTAVEIQDRTATLPIGFSPATASAISLQLLNAAALQGSPLPLAQSVEDVDAANAPAAAGLAADGASAAVIVFQSSSADAVTFTVTAPGISTGIGSVTAYSKDHLINPVPGTLTTYTDSLPINLAACTASTGSSASNPPCVFVDLLYSPASMPNTSTAGISPTPLLLTVQAVQTASNGSQDGTVSNSISLMPPPMVLVHGVWSSGAAAWPSFEQWLFVGNYPHQLVFRADYGAASSLSFDDFGTQEVLATTIANAIAAAAQRGIIAQKVDVVAHSMGGLVTRYLVSAGAPLPNYLPRLPVHKLITLGTPHQGSAMATVLDTNAGATFSGTDLTVPLLCLANGFTKTNCTLSIVFSLLGKQVGGATQSLEPNSKPLQSLTDTGDYRSIVGLSPTASGTAYGSTTEALLDGLIGDFVSGGSVTSILGSSSDTIVNAVSQVGNPIEEATITNVVHTALSTLDTGETSSPAFWSQAVYWLLGEGTGQAPGAHLVGPTSTSHAEKTTPRASSSTAPAPNLALTGYTQVSASNVTFSPSPSLPLAINSTVNIAATSSSKTLSEVLLFQTVSDPSDIPFYAVTQSPFSISYTPTRVGTANFTAFAVFSDMTFATLPLNYTLQPSGSALTLSLQASAANLPIGLTTTVPATAGFANGPVDVTKLAKYTTGSGGSTVFAIGSGGSITTTGNGIDILNVSYGGVSASAQISVGSCSYALSPPSQIVDYGGASVSIQVAAQSGCAWIAASDSSWLTLAQATGSASGAITAVAAPNTTGSPRTAYVTIGNADVAVIQPATACTYSVTPSSLSLSPAGGSGTLAVSTACPMSSSSNATWANVTTLSSTSVAYTVDANTTSQSRSATLVVGTQQVSVVEAAASVPALTLNPSSVSFGNQIIGSRSPAASLTLSNSGTAALTIGSVSVTGTDAAEFALTNNCGNSIAVGANCTLSVVFAPTHSGAATASVTISDNASDSPQTIALSGLGTVPPSFTVSGGAVTISGPGTTTGNTATISVTPTGGFTGAVTLTASVTSSPNGAQDLPLLSFGSTSPLNITGSAAATATLTISTTAASISALAIPESPKVGWFAGGVALASLMMFGIPRRRRNFRTIVALLALVGITTCAIGCPGKTSGGSGTMKNPGTTAGSYIVTVTATSGSTSAQGTVAVTVQ